MRRHKRSKTALKNQRIQMDESLKLISIFFIGAIVLAALFIVTANNSPNICNCPNVPTNATTTQGPLPCRCQVPLSSTTINYTTNTTTYGSSNELTNVQQVEPNANASIFYCTTSSECIIVHTSLCFNNLPSQQ